MNYLCWVSKSGTLEPLLQCSLSAVKHTETDVPATCSLMMDQLICAGQSDSLLALLPVYNSV